MTQPVPPPPPPTGSTPVGVIAAFEASVAALVLAAYTAWLATVSTAVLAAFTLFRQPPDPGAIWATVPQWERSVERLLTSLEEIARRGWEDTTRQLGLDLPFNPDDPIVVEQLARTRNLMVRTPDEVYRRIIDVLGQSLDAGESVQEQAARVRHVLDVTGTENWPSRAQTVAVTEVHRAWNFGALAAGLRVQQQSGRRLLKQWLTKDDSAVRTAHRLANRQIQFASQPFIVAGEALMAPGDPSGSPWNVINCRCKPRFFRGDNGGR